MRAVLLAAAWCLLGITAVHAQAVTTYNGACDGSAAVALDDNLFVAGNDDDNVLRIYRFGTGAPLAAVDLDDLLGTKADSKTGAPKEADIEGAARVGKRIYWIASHGRDRRGGKETSRRRLFATDIVGPRGARPPALAFAGSYRHLLDDLGEQLGGLGLKKGAATAPENSDGLNIEGLAATPDGRLFIGFRNPRPHRRAIVVPLENADAAIGGKARAKLGTPELIDLGGRGIRSIEWIGERFVIVAGPFDDGARPGGGFALYTWAGPGGAPPRRDTRVDFRSLDLHPESIFAKPGTDELYLLSDDGTDACKKAPPERKSFRGVSVGNPS